MDKYVNPSIREDLVIRRSKLERTIQTSGDDKQLRRLINEVDAALHRLDEGTYGLCEICHEPIENERIINDPLVRFCLDHLQPEEQRALEEDLLIASQIQSGLLPPKTSHFPGWDFAYHYEAAGVVSGDYCDILIHQNTMYFSIGDVSGKGVSSALLMAHLHATFRALVAQGMNLEQIMERASRIFCEVSLPTYFATLVCGKATQTGEIELCSAGHNPALISLADKVDRLDATGLPLGMFCDEEFSTITFNLNPGDSLFLYTDGLTEAMDTNETEYGMDRLSDTFTANRNLKPAEIIDSSLKNLNAFRIGSKKSDDLTIMVIRRL
ncbi:MAG TPA: SpoIIE family protein phosphatase [Balneolales bacterium]|nr:SpoIIE family protein phosphatase [Balneolales bacterium]